MKTKIVKTEEAINIIYDYWNQMGKTISDEAKNYLVSEIENISIEIEL